MKAADLLTSRSLALVPLLMLPIAVAALWLAANPGATGPRVVVVAGSVAIAWYLLGGWIAGHRMRDELRLRRQLRSAHALLRDESGCAWVVDPEGTVRAQSETALRRRDLTGRQVSTLLAPDRAQPETAAASLMGRVAAGRTVRLGLRDGGTLTAEPVAGTPLQLWRLSTPVVAPPESPPPAVPVDFGDLPVALLELSPQGQVRSANAAAQVLLGPVAPGVFLGDLLDGLGRPLTDWIAEVREGRDTGRGEVMHARAEGIERDVQVTLAASPETGRMVAVLTDASALKTLEAQFVQSQKMQAIGQLAGGIAHDFNNLLTAISGHCDLLMLRRDRTDPDYDDLHQISQNANRAAALVRQLLAFSRKQTLKPEIVNLRDVLSDLTHLLNRLVGERIVLTVTNDPSLRAIRADARQLEQVLMNLVVNARDAMPDGGQIAIQTENVRLGTGRQMERVSLPRGDYVRITVTDQGCGIPADTLAKIFDPFFTTKKPGEGTGLGLATAYGIVKQTGGHIFCDSTVGEGTTFTMYFPAQRAGTARPADRSQAEAVALSSPSPDERQRTILLVEDEAPVRAFASRALKLRGFQVIEADNGERALDILTDERITVDMFVTDVVMPGMDGPTWVRAALRDRPGTRIIFTSGYTEVTLSGSDSPIPNALFLPKPFSLGDLLASVENHLSGRPGPARPTDNDTAVDRDSRGSGNRS